jgi:hypothetical protein
MRVIASRLPLLAALAALAPASAPAQAAGAADPARAFFARHEVVHVRIRLAPGSREELRQNPREYARATLRIGDAAFPDVAVKLKGAAGSFRDLDDRPGFTVNLGKHGAEARFHGLRRFHLNNSVQDDTWLCEWIGHDVFAAAGLPAPRVAHARVWLEERDLGLYVLREAYDRQFLLRAFGSTAGNLYDGGFCQDIDSALEKDSGDGPDDHSDLRRLHDACAGVDRDREQELAARIDLPRFLDFLALERLLGHWDGYSITRNNYRLWLPTDGGAVFLPHGMDQLFGDPEASVLDHPPAIVASAVLQQPALRKRFRERLKALLPLLAPNRLVPRVQKAAARLQIELRADADAARAHADAVRGLCERIAARHDFLSKEVKGPEPRPVALAVGRTMPLKTWHPAAETDAVDLARKSFQGQPALVVRCEQRGSGVRHGVFRAHLLLAAGRYAMTAVVRCENVRTDDDGGAFLQVGEATSQRLTGDRGWQALRCEFEVREFQRTVEFTCQLRALAGTAWFRLDSLLLERLPDDDRGR